MQCLPNESTFRYKPLPDSQNFIRLIEVQSLDENPNATVSAVCL